MKNIFLTRKISTLALSILAATSLVSSSHAQEEFSSSITVYGNSSQMVNGFTYGGYYEQEMPGYAIYSDFIKHQFSRGFNKITVNNIPPQADPSSFIIKSLGAGRTVVEQESNFSKDGHNLDLSSYIGEEIEVEQGTGERLVYKRGELLSVMGDKLLIREEDKQTLINGYVSIALPETSSSMENFVNWTIHSNESSTSDVQYSYRINNIGWVGTYELYLTNSNGQESARMEGWANIFNNSTLVINDSQLKLVAGETNSAPMQKTFMARAMMADSSAGGAEVASAPSFALNEQNFSEYHIYTTGRKVSLKPNSSKKVKIFDDRNNIQYTRDYVYDSSIDQNKVAFVISMQNLAESGLGLPLPAGKFRIFEKDPSGEYELIGEDQIAHTSVGNKLTIRAGKAMDITPTRTVTNETQNPASKTGRYSVKLVFENAKENDVKIDVLEAISQANWKVSDASEKYTKESANQIKFGLKIPARSKAEINYSVDYSW